MDELEQIVKLVDSIKEKNPALGDILSFNLNVSFGEYQALVENKPMDISEKIQMVSKILGIDFEEMVEHILNNKQVIDPNKMDQEIVFDKSEIELEEYIKKGEYDHETSEEEYQKFLEEMQKIG